VLALNLVLLLSLRLLLASLLLVIISRLGSLRSRFLILRLFLILLRPIASGLSLAVTLSRTTGLRVIGSLRHFVVSMALFVLLGHHLDVLVLSDLAFFLLHHYFFCSVNNFITTLKLKF
jgi:hypothetical protein